MNTKVSVIMTAYNSELYIRKAINSVLDQTFQDFEFIIVNDASSDETENILSNYSKRNSKMRVINLSQNVGAAKARNCGLDLAKGDIISFLDSDDMWLNDKLETQLKFMKENNVDFCYSNYKLIDSNGKNIKDICIPVSCIDFQTLLRSNYIPFLTVMISRKLISEIRFVNIHHEDYALWLHILQNGSIAYLFPRITAKYRDRADSISGNKIKSICWTWNIYRKYLNLPMHNSVFYLLTNVFNGIRKHQRFFKRRNIG